ncbi:hypothetical protein GCM10009574_073920 [Streptomyces asiaticus]|uniref:ParB-like N-terminal domain-containing protein n=3 Tax=Streptomyces TaxID=1883 RepID=A0ABN1P150_9ACTN
MSRQVSQTAAAPPRDSGLDPTAQPIGVAFPATQNVGKNSPPFLDAGGILGEQAMLVPIHLLLESDSPRVDGEDTDYVKALAESGARLPPIVVHRATRRVVDGMHRLRAAELRGQESIEAQFFEGSTSDAFVLSVWLNTAHGLSLSTADRSAAALRIIRSHPQWSLQQSAG